MRILEQENGMFVRQRHCCLNCLCFYQGYKVFYTKKPEDPIFFWEQQEVKSDNRLATISGLTPNVTYTISVLAYSGVGQGPMSHPTQVLTTQGGRS